MSKILTDFKEIGQIVWKAIRRTWLKLFPTYRILETRVVTYAEGDAMIRGNYGKPEKDQWIISDLEDGNYNYGFVFLERRERILE